MGLGKTMSVVALVAATLYVSPGPYKRPPGINYVGPTLVVCPPSIATQWADEFSTSSKGIRVLVSMSKLKKKRRVKLMINIIRSQVHHGDKKIKKVEDFMMYNVVITSYNMVTNEWRGKKDMLFKVFWKRIVLDEGHLIRNFKTQVSEAVCSLYGKFRWILTGTPIHNRIDDVFPYFVFLRCDPFDERTIFLKWAKDRHGGRQGQGRLNVILKALMIRRTKEELKTVPAEKIVQGFEYELEAKENEVYKRLMFLSQSMMKIFLNERARTHGNAEIYQGKDLYKIQKIMQKRLNGYISSSHIFVLLLRLRQLCCHPALISNVSTHFFLLF